MSDPATPAQVVENVLAPAVKQAADKLAAAVGVTDPAVIAEYEATLSHAAAAVVGSLAPLVEKFLGGLLNKIGANTAAK